MTRFLPAPRAVALGLLAALAIGAALPAAASAASADDVTWTVRTASNALGQDRTNFSYALNPGAHLDDGLVVANRGSTAIELDVYASDGYTTATGALDLRVAGDASSGVGAWITVPAGHVSVGAGETATVPFAVDVPAGATPGDYVGGVVSSLTVADRTANVTVDRRLGIRTSVRVGGDLAPALAIDDVRVDWDGGPVPLLTGRATLHYTVRNSGNTVLAAADGGTVAGPFGWAPVDVEPGDRAPSLLPGESWQRDATASGVGALLLLTATATATPLMTDASGSTTALDTVTAPGIGWAVPWPALLLVLAVAAAVVWGPRWLRARRTRRQSEQDARVSAEVERRLAQERHDAASST